MSTIYCTYELYRWKAKCLIGGKDYESCDAHDSARQAANEVLARIRDDYDLDVTMRRVHPKQYEISLCASALQRENDTCG